MTTLSTSTETERKFAVGAGEPVPELTGVPGVASVGDPRSFLLVATYYDTDDLALARARMTLRRRTGGEDAGWHLKQPASGDSRTELGEPLSAGSSVTGVPASLRAEIAGVIGMRPLLPVAVLRTRRTVRDLLDEAGQPLAEVTDDTVTATRLADPARGRAALADDVSEWRELEVELKGEGTPEVLEAVTGALTAAGIGRSESVSKLRQALGDRLDDPAPALGDAPSAANVVLRHLRDQVGVIQNREADVRADAPDAVHKTRVATRRLRSALKTFRPLLDEASLSGLDEELRWFAGVLGGARDGEVMLARLTASVDRAVAAGGLTEEQAATVRARIDSDLRGKHEAAHAELVRALDDRRHAHLLDRLVRLVAQPAFVAKANDPASDVLPRLVEKSARKVDRKASEADAVDIELDPSQHEMLLHEVRKKAKAARYASESVTGVFGETATATAQGWEQVTEVLGEHQDSAVLREEIDRLAAAAREAGADTYPWGVLAGLELASGALSREAYTAALAAVQAPESRAWMTSRKVARKAASAAAKAARSVAGTGRDGKGDKGGRRRRG